MAKRYLALLLCLICAVLLPAAAFAEECFLIDIDALDMTRVSDSAYVQQYLSAPSQGLRVRKYISDSNELAARVQLTITQAETSSVVYQRNYGYVSGTFDSGDIYLPYVDNSTIPYIVTLNIEDWTYALPFMQLQQRLAYNGGCTYGLRLRDANAALTDSWIMGTMLDLDQLRAQGSQRLPVCASNLYVVGQAALTLAGDRLTVSLSFEPSANVTLNGCAVYLIADVAGMTTADPSAMPQRAYGLGEAIDVSGLHAALLYLPMSLSYDPAGLGEFAYDANSADIAAQWSLWYAALQTGGGAQSTPEPTVEPEAWATAEPTAEPTALPTAEPVADPTAAPVDELLSPTPEGADPTMIP